MTLPRRLGGGSSECGTIFGRAPEQPRGITYLAHTEFSLLCELASETGHVFTKAERLRKV